MKTERKLSLKSYEDIFSTEEMRQDAKREKVMDLSVSDLHPFKNHPFKVLDDDKMRDTVQSIREHGVLLVSGSRYTYSKQCMCGHKCEKPSAGVPPFLTVLLVGGTSPNPLGHDKHAAAHSKNASYFSDLLKR